MGAEEGKPENRLQDKLLYITTNNIYSFFESTLSMQNDTVLEQLEAAGDRLSKQGGKRNREIAEERWTKHSSEQEEESCPPTSSVVNEGQRAENVEKPPADL